MNCSRIFALHISLVLIMGSLAGPATAQEPISVESKRELFVDGLLVDSLDGARLKLHEPTLEDVALRFDRPYEGKFCGYITVIKDGDTYRMYYRGMPEAGSDYSDNEVTCYAESDDGITWTKPDLGLHEYDGSKDNNIILAKNEPFSHNFSPFLDTQPDVPEGQRFKALAGSRRTGLHGFVSPDGIHWEKISDEPLITEGAFDSQNVAFWSGKEGQYVSYFRIFREVDGRRYRGISRTVSKDFLDWSKPQAMTYGNTPPEHLYTNQTHPYFRAPHIYISIPMRFMPGLRVLTTEEAKQLGVHVSDQGPSYAGDAADAVFMSTRGGTEYDRTFMEGFIRPGADLGNWASRAGMVALGVVPTGPAEMSIYKQAHYAQPSAHLLRYTLRTDGFVSVNGPYEGGEMITKPLTHTGDKLFLNFATSAAGSVRVEILDSSKQPLDGYTLSDCDPVIGDRIDHAVTWNGSAALPDTDGAPIRLRFVLADADVYALQFRGK